MTTYNSTNAKCPFYCGDSKYFVRCEGIVEDSTLTLSFRSQKEREKQFGLFCCDEYEKCEIYRMVMEAKY